MAEAIEDVLANNIGSVSQFSTVWEAFKMYFRGIAISKHSGVLHAIRSQLVYLERQLTELEAVLCREGAVEGDDELQKTLVEYQEAADNEVQHMGKYAVTRSYGEGDRPGATLAALLRRRREASMITAILSEDGELVTDPEHIANQFRHYYDTLYRSRPLSDDSTICDFLEHIKLPLLTNDQQEYLMRLLEAWEMHEALRHMRSGSAPGQDGLTVTFYKEFKDLLTPHLVTLFEELYERGKLPPTLREAMKVTIPKPGKSPEECSSYCPLSLLNVDTKIDTKILANRLASLVQSLAGAEQVG